jgi:hypothetical protein
MNWRRRSGLVVMAVSLIGIAALWARYDGLRSHSEGLAREVRQLEGEWAGVSRNLEDARKVQPKYENFLHHTDLILAEFKAPRWTPALRSIAQASSEAGIDVEELRVVKLPRDTDAYALSIAGVSTGDKPRLLVDEFRSKLQVDLGQRFVLRVPPTFARLEETNAEFSSGGGKQGRIRFSISTTIVLPTPPNPS